METTSEVVVEAATATITNSAVAVVKEDEEDVATTTGTMIRTVVVEVDAVTVTTTVANESVALVRVGNGALRATAVEVEARAPIGNVARAAATERAVAVVIEAVVVDTVAVVRHKEADPLPAMTALTVAIAVAVAVAAAVAAEGTAVDLHHLLSVLRRGVDLDAGVAMIVTMLWMTAEAVGMKGMITVERSSEFVNAPSPAPLHDVKYLCRTTR